MEAWDNDDYERPIEDYPGYILCYVDGSFQPHRWHSNDGCHLEIAAECVS